MHWLKINIFAPHSYHNFDHSSTSHSSNHNSTNHNSSRSSVDHTIHHSFNRSFNSNHSFDLLSFHNNARSQDYMVVLTHHIADYRNFDFAPRFVGLDLRFLNFVFVPNSVCRNLTKLMILPFTCYLQNSFRHQ